jgi:hypothetical protein
VADIRKHTVDVEDDQALAIRLHAHLVIVHDRVRPAL